MDNDPISRGNRRLRSSRAGRRRAYVFTCPCAAGVLRTNFPPAFTSLRRVRSEVRQGIRTGQPSPESLVQFWQRAH
jgi:hypothetical protein